MSLRHYYKLLTGKLKVKKAANLSYANIKAVLQSFYRRGREIAGMYLPPHIYEQIIWRRTQVIEKSPECWEKGYCKVCGCEILGKTMEDRPCESEVPCYPAMIKNPEDWKEYKEQNNIKLFE